MNKEQQARSSHIARRHNTLRLVNDAITELRRANKPISIKTITDAVQKTSGKRIAGTTFYRNPDVNRLFRKHSTFLTEGRRRKGQEQHGGGLAALSLDERRRASELQSQSKWELAMTIVTQERLLAELRLQNFSLRDSLIEAG